MTDADLSRLEALADAATLRGSWQQGRAGSCNVVDYDGDDIVGVAVVPDEANAVFIAAARTAVPALIADLRAERARADSNALAFKSACADYHAERARTERLVGLLREVYGAPQFDDSPLPQDLCDRIDAELAREGE